MRHGEVKHPCSLSMWQWDPASDCVIVCGPKCGPPDCTAECLVRSGAGGRVTALSTLAAAAVSSWKLPVSLTVIKLPGKGALT